MIIHLINLQLKFETVQTTLRVIADTATDQFLQEMIDFLMIMNLKKAMGSQR